MKSRVKSGAESNGVETRACLSASNDSCACLLQTKGIFLQSRQMNPWDFVVYSGTQQGRKLALPWRLYSWCRVFGGVD